MEFSTTVKITKSYRWVSQGSYEGFFKMIIIGLD